MMRVIVTPAVLPPAALAELKHWLGITTTRTMRPAACWPWRWMSAPIYRDGAAGATVKKPSRSHRRMAIPARWIGKAAFSRRLVGDGRDGWHRLGVRPVSALISVEALSRPAPAAPWQKSNIPPASTAKANARSASLPPLASSGRWSALPRAWQRIGTTCPNLRHGIIRLAAHQYRMRESAGADALPPASVTALWRPWRRMRWHDLGLAQPDPGQLTAR
jgi:hypothetical protein